MPPTVKSNAVTRANWVAGVKSSTACYWKRQRHHANQELRSQASRRRANRELGSLARQSIEVEAEEAVWPAVRVMRDQRKQTSTNTTRKKYARNLVLETGHFFQRNKETGTSARDSPHSWNKWRLRAAVTWTNHSALLVSRWRSIEHDTRLLRHHYNEQLGKHHETLPSCARQTAWFPISSSALVALSLTHLYIYL